MMMLFPALFWSLIAGRDALWKGVNLDTKNNDVLVNHFYLLMICQTHLLSSHQPPLVALSPSEYQPRPQ